MAAARIDDKSGLFEIVKGAAPPDGDAPEYSIDKAVHSDLKEMLSKVNAVEAEFGELGVSCENTISVMGKYVASRVEEKRMADMPKTPLGLEGVYRFLDGKSIDGRTAELISESLNLAKVVMDKYVDVEKVGDDFRHDFLFKSMVYAADPYDFDEAGTIKAREKVKRMRQIAEDAFDLRAKGNHDIDISISEIIRHVKEDEFREAMKAKKYEPEMVKAYDTRLDQALDYIDAKVQYLRLINSLNTHHNTSKIYVSAQVADGKPPSLCDFLEWMPDPTKMNLREEPIDAEYLFERAMEYEVWSAAVEAKKTGKNVAIPEHGDGVAQIRKDYGQIVDMRPTGRRDVTQGIEMYTIVETLTGPMNRLQKVVWDGKVPSALHKFIEYMGASAMSVLGSQPNSIKQTLTTIIPQYRR